MITQVNKPEFTTRGFEVITAQTYPVIQGETDDVQRLVQESSLAGNKLPGDSFLWIGDKHHLEREQVKDLANRLLNWYHTGTFHTDEELKQLK